MKATVTKCDVCGEVIPEGARRLALRADLSVFNSHRKSLARRADDICGEVCLLACIRALLTEVEIQPAVAPHEYIDRIATGTGRSDITARDLQ
jgi:hypothetical protein